MSSVNANAKDWQVKWMTWHHLSIPPVLPNAQSEEYFVMSIDEYPRRYFPGVNQD